MIDSNPTKVMVDRNGVWWAVLPGQRHSLEMMHSAALELGTGDELVVKVEHLAYTPRIKWCGRQDWPCDQEGDWHGHWFDVSPSPTSAHTLVRLE